MTGQYPSENQIIRVTLQQQSLPRLSLNALLLRVFDHDPIPDDLNFKMIAYRDSGIAFKENLSFAIRVRHSQVWMV